MPAPTEDPRDVEESPSACVRDVPGDVVANHNGQWDEVVERSELSILELDDVDGDGAPEQLVFSEHHWCGVSGKGVFALYLSGNGCLRSAGTVAFNVESMRVLERTRHGVRDLEVS